VLTGKKALEFSGSVSAPDHQGIGGLEKIMGPNGEAQYAASDLADAVRTLFHYYRATYVAPGEARPRALPSSDAAGRDVSSSPASEDFARVGDIFSEAHNPGRKRPFDVRTIMRALIDADDLPLERWAPMRDAEGVIVWDAHLGGHAVSVIGTDARTLPRHGMPPADGPEKWTPSTLFPRGSKKIARALDAASGRRPVVILANLAGFDGSPESLRRLQLEYGAEIGRAVVEFKGPILFCVLSRYHGGAYVVFSRALNASLRAFALEGSYASVIGGAPAAAVVFRHEVDRRTKADPRLTAFKARDPQRASAERQALQRLVETEKLGEVATEFDAVHTVERARQVGSLDEIVKVSELRRRLIEELAKK
jgi:acetyl-CoA carboxylase carboxyltransferase component